jgi:hypothetical protein
VADVVVVAAAAAVEINRIAFSVSSRCAKARRLFVYRAGFSIARIHFSKFRILSVFIRIDLWLKSLPDADDAAH